MTIQGSALFLLSIFVTTKHSRNHIFGPLRLIIRWGILCYTPINIRRHSSVISREGCNPESSNL